MVASISSSLLEKYRYTALVDMPVAATTSSMDVAWNPALAKQLQALVKMCCLRWARRLLLSLGTCHPKE